MPRAPVLLSMRKYAAWRKSRGLQGQSHSAVSKAIQSGRLTASVSYDDRGRTKIDKRAADKEWKANTSSTKQREPLHVPDEILPDEDQGVLFEGAGPEPSAEDAPSGAPPIASTLAVRAVYLAQLTRLQYERAADKLVEKAAVDARAFTLYRSVRETLLQIPGRIADQVAIESDSAACFEAMDAEIRAALKALTSEE